MLEGVCVCVYVCCQWIRLVTMAKEGEIVDDLMAVKFSMLPSPESISGLSGSY